MKLLIKITRGIIFVLLAVVISGCASLEESINESINLSLIDRAVRQPNERVDALSAEPTKPFKIIGYLAIRTFPELEPHVIQAFVKKAAQSGADAIILSRPNLGQVPNEDLMLVGNGFNQSFNESFNRSYELSAKQAAARAAAEDRRRVVFKATMIVYNSPDKS